MRLLRTWITVPFLIVGLICGAITFLSWASAAISGLALAESIPSGNVYSSVPEAIADMPPTPQQIIEIPTGPPQASSDQLNAHLTFDKLPIQSEADPVIVKTEPTPLLRTPEAAVSVLTASKENQIKCSNVKIDISKGATFQCEPNKKITVARSMSISNQPKTKIVFQPHSLSKRIKELFGNNAETTEIMGLLAPGFEDNQWTILTRDGLMYDIVEAYEYAPILNALVDKTVTVRGYTRQAGLGNTKLYIKTLRSDDLFAVALPKPVPIVKVHQPPPVEITYEKPVVVPKPQPVYVEQPKAYIAKRITPVVIQRKDLPMLVVIQRRQQ